MEGNHLIPSAAEFARAFDEPFPRVCPDCRGTGMLALGMDGSIIGPRERPGHTPAPTAADEPPVQADDLPFE